MTHPKSINADKKFVWKNPSCTKRSSLSASPLSRSPASCMYRSYICTCGSALITIKRKMNKGTF